VRWLRDAILTSNTTRVVDGEEVRCDSPTRLRGRRLAGLDADDPVVVSDLCPSVVVPFFDATTVARLGDRVQLDCRAIGRPTPRLHWILPHRTVLNASSDIDAGRLAVDAGGTLTVAAVRASDFGTYTCVALNARGYDAAATSLSASDPLPCQVESGKDDGRPRPRLLVKGVASTFIAVSRGHMAVNDDDDDDVYCIIVLYRTVNKDSHKIYASSSHLSKTHQRGRREVGRRKCAGASTFIAVTWNGTDVPGAMGSGRSRGVRYAIVYREDDRDNSVSNQIGHDEFDGGGSGDPVYKGRIDLRPYMRAFTVNNLRPKTHYEFCIGCELEDHTGPPSFSASAATTWSPVAPPRRHSFYRSNCIRIRTRESAETSSRFGGAEDGVRVVFGVAVVITTVAVLSLCGLLVVIRRIGRRVSYHEAPGRWNAADDCVDARRQRRDEAIRTTLIPLTNLVELSSTPVSSSKTSLLHAI